LDRTALVICVATVVLAVSVAAVVTYRASSAPAGPHSADVAGGGYGQSGAGSSGPPTTLVGVAPAAPTARICQSGLLESPYGYSGKANTFTSGRYGLPTFGSPGTDFPGSTRGLIVHPGNNTGISESKLEAGHVVVYFEPGVHANLPSILPRIDSAYIGGYSKGSGEAEIDGGGEPGHTFAGTGPNVTIEYLTIANFDGTSSASSFGGSIVDEDGGFNWRVDHDTVGPNGDTVGQDYTGYGIGVGSHSTYEYDCVTGNGEGGFNNGGSTSILRGSAPWGGPANFSIEHDEISHNAIGAGYVPTASDCLNGTNLDQSGTVWCDPDGVAAGLKVFWSDNGTIDYNYVHDNYGEGLWPDTDNTGLDISYNYISDNMDAAIDYEASFNANITANTITGNGWDPEGSGEWAGWPNGYQTSNGGGPGFVDGAIFINNSGGDADIQSGASRYLGHIYIEGNDLVNNFGGIDAFMDRNRFCGEGADGGFPTTCTLSGGYSGGAQRGSPYYVQPTSYNDDATLTPGSTTITAGGGFHSNYQGARTEPASGWAVGAYNTGTGEQVRGIIPAGDTIASCSSNTTCTLMEAAAGNLMNGSGAGGSIEIEAGPPGGCGMYDLTGSSEGESTGTPPEPYFDNCDWYVQGLTVSGNYFTMNANTVTGCAASNGCGYMALYASEGPCTYGCFWSPYQGDTVARKIISPASDNVWDDNTYEWTGKGGWSFEAGATGNTLSPGRWQRAPFGQDVRSTGL
jgi:Right handed beta helix region